MYYGGRFLLKAQHFFRVLCTQKRFRQFSRDQLPRSGALEVLTHGVNGEQSVCGDSDHDNNDIAICQIFHPLPPNNHTDCWGLKVQDEEKEPDPASLRNPLNLPSTAATCFVWQIYLPAQVVGLTLG
jgi:hypothetical protein